MHSPGRRSAVFLLKNICALPSLANEQQPITQALGAHFAAVSAASTPRMEHRELMESPARTESILRHLKTEYGADSVQFYDMNFFLRESHAVELAERLAPLDLRWWCEARIDTFNRYSNANA